MSFPEHSTPDRELYSGEPEQPNRPDRKTQFKHLILFLLTFITVSFTGILWVGQSAQAEGFLDMLPEGMLFASVFLLFLATHEFGHYFAAVYHKVRVTLPYFIPIPVGIGTIGAVIRIKEKIEDTTKLFDIGIAGPIAGFIISVATLLYGFGMLPGPEFITNFEGHEDVIAYVEQNGTYPELLPSESDGMVIILGNTLFYDFLASFFDHVPPMWEMYHYPFLFAGWLGLFFTALNLMPIGQLDGGHILYSLIGYRKHRTVARGCFGLITGLAGVEAIPVIYQTFDQWLPSIPQIPILIWAGILYFLLQKTYRREAAWVAPVWAISILFSLGMIFLAGNGLEQSGSLIWLFWSFFLAFFVGLEHPPAMYERQLSPTRRVLGWTSMVIFLLCISPNPIYFLN